MHLRVLRRCTLLILIVLMAIGGVKFHAAAQDDALPDMIVYTFPDHFPEGIAWDEAGQRFLLGSLTGGPILAVTDDGTATPFVEFEAPRPSIGLEVDAARNRLLVVFSDPSIFTDPTSTGVAMLGAYDLETGEEIWLADLAYQFEEERHFANDVVVHPETGIAYITDSLVGAIYFVNPDGGTGTWVYDDALKGAPGANGIEILPEAGDWGDLMIANMSTQTLYLVGLVPPGDNRLLLRPVEIDGGATTIGGDGLIFDEHGVLTVVGRYSDASGYSGFGVLQLTSDDEWVTATTIRSAQLSKQASTAALRDGAAYVIYPEFIALNTGQSVDEFTIERVELVDVEIAPIETAEPEN